MAMYKYDGELYTLEEVESDYRDYCRECCQFDKEPASWKRWLVEYELVEIEEAEK